MGDDAPAAAAAPALRPGVDVDHFRVIRLLGVGGMGQVWLARDMQLGRKVALKLINPARLGSADARARFLSEAAATAAFSHPNIVTLYEVGEHAGAPYVALELIEGDTLKDRLDRERPSLRQALELGHAVASATAEAHRHAVLHLDLKPSNVVIGKDGRARVVDFGLARRYARPAARGGRSRPDGSDDDGGDSEPVDHDTSSAPRRRGPHGELAASPFDDDEAAALGAAPAILDEAAASPGPLPLAHAGTPRYMAPEQWRGDAETPATDVWALGLILHELVHGRHPYGDLGKGALRRAVTGDDDVPAATAGPAPPAVIELVAACLAKVASMRPTAEQVADVLARSLERTSHPAAGENPFRGLLPFTERQADAFFGRDAELGALLERLRDEPVLPIVGPSGAGKSSFVQAGVIPRLREAGAWSVLMLRPGARPFAALAELLLTGEASSAPGPSAGGDGTTATRTVAAAGGAPAATVASVPEAAEAAEGAGGAEPAPAAAAAHALAIARDGAPAPGGTVTDPAAAPPAPPAAAPPAPPASAASAPPAPPAPPAAAAPAAEDPRALAEELAAHPEALGLRLRAFADAARVRVLLFVDQLEELYAMVDDDQVRRAFMRAILAAADDRDDPVRVCFTLRDDFLGKAAEDEPTRAALGRVTVLRAPGADALREILEVPAARAGFAWEAGVVDDIIAAVRGQAGSLPVVQFTARQVWHRRDADRRLLTRKAYDEIGGVAGALAAHADGVLAGLAPDDVRAARAVCLRLVAADGTRRVVPRAELIAGLAAGADDVVDRLVEARLLTARRGKDDDAAGGDASAGAAGAEIELAHESLVRGWDRLARWHDQARDELTALDEVAQAAALWARRGRRPAELWRGDALAEARRRLARVATPLPAPVARFLAACERAARRARWRKRSLVAGLVLGFAAIAIAAVAVAVRIGAEERAATRRLAEAQREGARAALAAGDPLEARAKLRASLETEDSPLGRALWLSLSRSPEGWRRPFAAGVYGVALSPDERTAAAVGQDGAAYLVDLDTAQARVLHGVADQLFSVAFSPDGRAVAAGAWNGAITIWDVATGRPRRLDGHGGQVTGLAFRDAGELISVSTDGTLRRWDVARGVERARYSVGDDELSALDVDGDVAVTVGGNSVVRRWDLDRGTAVALASVPAGTVRIDRARRVAAIGGKDGTLRLLPLDGGPATIVGGQVGRVTALALAGDRLIAAAADGALHVWDLAAGREVAVLEGHKDETDGLALTADGARLVSASNDQTLRLWRLGGAAAPRREPGHSMPVVGVDITADGTTLVSAAYDQTVRAWDAATGAERAILRGHRGRVWAVRVVPRSHLAISAGNDATLQLWDLDRGVATAELVGHDGAVIDVAVDDTGQLAASGSADGTVRLWDLRSATPLRTFAAPGTVDGVALTGDRRLVAGVGHFRTVLVWDVATGALVHQLRGHTATVPGVAFSRDGARAASCSEDGELRVWDLATETGRVVWRGQRLYRVAFSPDGTRVAAAGADGVGHIIDLATGADTPLRGHVGEINEVRFSGDGALAVSGGNDGTVRLWDAATGAPRWRAVLVRAGAGEVLDHGGWRALGGGALAAAPAPAAWRTAAAAAELGAESADGARVCLLGGGALALWDVAGDRALARWPVDAAAPRLVAAAGGCALADGTRATLFRPDRDALALGADVTALDASGAALLVARGERIERVGAGAEVQPLARAEPGATAVAEVQGGVVAGYPDGNAVLLADGGKVAMEAVPASPVIAARAGPAGTVVLGFASGAVGLWHVASGVRVAVAAVHGPARHLVATRDRVVAVSELGDQVALDVAPLADDYCELLRGVWAAVPVTWEGDRPVRAPPPPHHRCAR